DGPKALSSRAGSPPDRDSEPLRQGVTSSESSPKDKLGGARPPASGEVLTASDLPPRPAAPGRLPGFIAAHAGWWHGRRRLASGMTIGSGCAEGVTKTLGCASSPRGSVSAQECRGSGRADPWPTHTNGTESAAARNDPRGSLVTRC